jgi:hypothetical protein
MASQYAGDDTAFPVDFTIPDDGDDDAAGTFNIASEALGDRTAFLKLRTDSVEELIAPAGTGYPPFTNPRTRIRCVSIHNFAITSGLATRAKTAPFAPFGGSNFTADTANASIVSGCLTFLATPGATTTQGVQYCIDPFVHNGATLSQLLISLQPAAGHGLLPTTQVSAGLFRKALAATTLTSLQSAGDFLTDAQSGVTPYQNPHDLTITPNQNNVIDTSAYSYFLQIWNEFGTNSLPNLRVFGMQVTHTAIADMRFP